MDIETSLAGFAIASMIFSHDMVLLFGSDVSTVRRDATQGAMSTHDSIISIILFT